MRHTISVLVRNEFGVLSRVVGMFSGRGYNIDSLNVAPTHDPKKSHVTIVTEGDDIVIEQICKQLHKLIDVIKVEDHTDGHVIALELAMFSLQPPEGAREEIMRLAEIYKAFVVDESPKTLTLRLTAESVEIDELQRRLEALGLQTAVRTGPLTIHCGA